MAHQCYKCLFIAGSFPPPMVGGSQVYYCNILSQCTTDDVILVTGTKDGDTEFDAGLPYTVLRKQWLSNARKGRLPTLRQFLYLLLLLPIWILRYRVSVVHLGAFCPNIIAAWLAARITRRSIIVTMHGEELTVKDLRSPWHTLRWLWELRMWASFAVLRRCDCIQANSDFTRRTLMGHGVPKDRIVVTTPGIDQSKMSCRKAIDAAIAEQLAGKRIVLTVGRFTPRKGQDRVLQAISRLLSSFPQLQYVIAGGVTDRDYHRKCEALIQKCGLQEHALILENLHTEGIAWLYDACEIFIMANYTMPDGDTEGYGIVFLEAGAFGKPVIGGRAGGAVDAVEDGTTGLLVDGTDVADIAHAIQMLLTDPEMARQMGEAGRRKVAENGWRMKSEQYRELLNRLSSSSLTCP